MTELVVRDAAAQQNTQMANYNPGIFALGPKEMVAQASSMATVLADVIEKQQLYSNIQGKKYVKAEGWATLGSMLGILPKERSVVEHTDGSFEAFVDLVSIRDGRVIGGGSALCSIDEKRWANAERYARRSMAVTRATGKAYRLGFAWVMALAGYEGTPSEEMPGGGDNVSYEEPPAPATPKTVSTTTAAKKAKEAELFSSKKDGHLERLGAVVGDQVTDPRQQERIIALMEGQPMSRKAVEDAIKTVLFEAQLEKDAFA